MKMSNPQMLILVDENDNEIGNMEKMDCHFSGQLHRAFSVFVFDDQDRTLIQRRALSKYHSGGLWANSCCGHPNVGEEVLEAAKRRLSEEVNVSATHWMPIFKTRYRAPLNKKMIENEFVHGFACRASNEPLLNPEEAMDHKWISVEELDADIRKNPDVYAYWFKHYFEHHLGELAHVKLEKF